MNAAVSSPVVRHPFGLPLGTVRATLALLICGFVWMVLLWHTDQKLPLSHFFLGSFVLLSFVSSPSLPSGSEKNWLPWALRGLFAVVSLGVVGYAISQDYHSVTSKLVPEDFEFRNWWLPFLAVTAGGFGLGRLSRLVLGTENRVFESIRAWLSVVAMILMAGEFVLFITMGSNDGAYGFLHIWQAIQLALVSAYFGTRA